MEKRISEKFVFFVPSLIDEDCQDKASRGDGAERKAKNEEGGLAILKFAFFTLPTEYINFALSFRPRSFAQRIPLFGRYSYTSKHFLVEIERTNQSRNFTII